VLPAGSLPVDDPVPLGPEALRSALYRLSRVCDVALVVGPLAVRQDRHPLVRLCDHVVYALEADGDAANEAGAGAVSELRAQGAHVLGVVVAAPPPPPIQEAMAAPAAAARPAWTFDFGAETRRAEPAPEWAEKPPSPAAPARRAAPQAPPSGDEPAPRAGVPLPNLGLPELGDREREEPVRAHRIEPPPGREDEERGRRELAAAAVATRRSSEEAQSVARDLDLGGRDFDFESERGSRWPLVGWIVLALALIWFLVGVGPKILDRWRASESPDDMLASERNREAEAAPAPSPPPSGTVEPAPATGTEGVSGPATVEPAPRPTESQPAPASGPPMQPVEGKPPTSPGAVSPPPAPAPATRESEPPVPSAPAAAANIMVWAVHVASYETERQAQVEIESLRRRGFEGRAVETDLGGKGIWFRVYVGAYATQAEALTVRDALLRLPEYDFAQVRRVPR
jgi:hypothetical protein